LRAMIDDVVKRSRYEVETQQWKDSIHHLIQM
jgi:hypothetical protein